MVVLALPLETEEDAPDGRLMAVPVKRTPTFSAAAPAALFEVRVRNSVTFFPYQVADNGRFLVDLLDSPSSEMRSGMTVVLNWMRR